jgi:hypothetical protein
MEQEVSWDALILVDFPPLEKSFICQASGRRGTLFVLSRIKSVGAQVQSSSTVALELTVLFFTRMVVHSEQISAGEAGKSD